MARALPQTQSDTPGQAPYASEWQSLRGELMQLLEQVETQVSRSGQEQPGHSGLSERMETLRYQVAEVEPDTRHREALKSVQKAVDRFNDRGVDPFAAAVAEPAMPPNPRDSLQSAIQQIREKQAEDRARAAEGGSQAQPATRQAQVKPPAAEPLMERQVQSLPRFDELADAISGISGRLERLESELKMHARSQTGNVKEIADQVAQLSHVVELLAGAVGETGQVKRLEAQIAGLARSISQGPQVDLSALTHRLDEVSATVGRLADLQVQYSRRADKEAIAQRLDDVTATIGRLADLQVQIGDRVENTPSAGLLTTGMASIEEGVRAIYDRIDTMEKHAALPQPELERLADEVARIAAMVRTPGAPQGLIELIDALNGRIGTMETRHADLGALKLDMDELRATVLNAMEPRFAAIELQIESLGDKVAERPADPSIGQLEAQVRQLVARMDQTGEQLTGIARLYTQAEARDTVPDFDALADLVASRTSEAMQRVEPAAPTGLSDAELTEIENRVTRVVEAGAKDWPTEELGTMRAGIREVNERLARLETSLLERARQAEAEGALAVPDAPMPVATLPDLQEMIAPEQSPRDPLEQNAATPPPVLTATPPIPVQPEPKQPARSDSMPANPADDAPLTDKPFPPETSPVRTALEAKNGPRKRHPGLLPTGVGSAADAVASAVETPQPPIFDPLTVAPPPRPASSLEKRLDNVQVAADRPPASDLPPPPNRNTFIEAHRRAARASGATPAAKAEPSGLGSTSLIGRALARFQTGRAVAPAALPTEAVAAPQPMLPVVAPAAAKPAKDKRPRGNVAKAERLLAGDKPAKTEWRPEPPVLPPAPAPSPEFSSAPESESVAGESFLTRHRKPILLGASVVALGFLTLNLINQRLSEAPPDVPQQAPAVAAPGDVGEAPLNSKLLDAQPTAEVSALPATPGVMPTLDSLATGAIDPGAALAFVPSDQPMPKAFVAASALAGEPAAPAPGSLVANVPSPAANAAVAIAPLPGSIESPLKVELPPDSVGPIELRQAAADGDARAQFEIAAIYTEGRAVPEDLAAAAKWYERAAAQGFAPAQYRLGNLYENGKGVDKDLVEAKLWYQRAAEAGNRMSMHNLAALYASGGLGKQDFDSAVQWFEQAAKRGLKDSQFNLGMLYARGLGVAQDMNASYRWFSLAALKGDKDAAKARDDIARSLDAETVKRLNAEVAAWTAQSIDLVANFAPIGTWSKGFDPGETIANPDVVKTVQAMLVLLGYDVGTPDGVAGPKTAIAIKDFERGTGMSEIGAVNPRLLAVLSSQPV